MSGRQVMFVAGALAVVILGVVLAISLSGGGGVSGDRILTSYGSVALGAVPGEQPEERWTVEPRADWIDNLAGDGRHAYVAVVENDDLEVVALGLSDGEQRWQAEAPGTGLNSQLAPVGRLLLVVRYDEFGDTGDEAVVSAFETDTGQLRWEFDAGESWASVRPVGTDRALVRSGGQDSEVALLEVATGEEAWSTDADWVAADADGVAYLDGDDLDFRSLSGERRWSADVTEETSDLALTSRHVVTLDEQNAVAYHRASGEEMWDEATDMESAWEIVGLPGDLLWVRGSDGSLILDDEGEEAWTEDDLSFGQIVTHGNRTLIVQVQDPGPEGGGEVEVYDAETGDRLASTDLDDQERIYPYERGPIGEVFAAGVILSRDGRAVRGYDIETLDERWEIEASEDAIGTLPVGGGLLVTSHSGDEAVVEFFR